MIEHFPEIVSQLAGIAERFCPALDCVDTGFIADGVLDELPTGSTLGATRVGGVDLNKQRMRDALSAVLALAPAPRGFTVGELAAKVHAMTGRSAAGYTIRQAAYDLRKLRSKQLVDRPRRSRRYHVPPVAARTIAALLTLRDQVVAPHPRRHPQPQNGSKTQGLDQHRPRLRTDPHPHADPLRRPRPHHPRSTSRLRMPRPTVEQATSKTNCRSGILKRLALWTAFVQTLQVLVMLYSVIHGKPPMQIHTDKLPTLIEFAHRGLLRRK